MDQTVIGVVIVAFRSADVIIPCVQSLFDSVHRSLRVVVVDNASPDDTVALLRGHAASQDLPLTEAPADAVAAPVPDKGVLVLRSAVNLGFAGGVNLGLRALLADPEVRLFWVLNPDCVVSPGTASAYARQAAETGPFALMGGRTIYLEPPQLIQSDGGRLNRLTGVCSNLNQGVAPEAAVPPTAMDFISGANMVASRQFIETCGLMVEDYFLYYEEVDWAFRRGSLPLVFCPQAVVHHHGGTAIGTGSLSRRPSPFANYFNYRNRMRFVRRFHPLALPTAYAFSLAKLLSLVAAGAFDEAIGGLAGLHQLRPPRAIAQQLSPEAAAIAFGHPAAGVAQP